MLKDSHHTEKTKVKLRALLLHRFISDETKKKMSEGQKKRAYNPNQWAKMHEVRKGFKS